MYTYNEHHRDSIFPECPNPNVIISFAVTSDDFTVILKKNIAFHVQDF